MDHLRNRDGEPGISGFAAADARRIWCRTRRIVQQGLQMPHAPPVGKKYFQQAVSGPAGQGGVGQGHDLVPSRHTQAAHRPRFSVSADSDVLLRQHAAQAQFGQGLFAVPVALMLVAQRGCDALQNSKGSPSSP